jgi:hypothetical protein
MFFEGLEREDVSRWPAGIFRRAFVRAYANQIGLDPDAVCREFVERFPEPVVTALPSAAVLASLIEAPLAGSMERPKGSLEASLPPALRLTLADNAMTHAIARLLPAPALRAFALACDSAVLLTVALAAFLLFDRFWMPLALAALTYFFGSLLVLSTTPSLWLLTSGERAADVDATLVDSAVGYPSVNMDGTRARA